METKICRAVLSTLSSDVKSTRRFSHRRCRLAPLQAESHVIVEALKSLARVSDYCLQTVISRFIVEKLLFIPRRKRFAYQAKRDHLRTTLKVSASTRAPYQRGDCDEVASASPRFLRRHSFEG